VGCAKNEVVKVGTPFDKNGDKGVDFHTDITNSESIGTLREIIKDESIIEQPKGLGEVADIFFSLDRPKESAAEIQKSVWYRDDGTSILYSEGSNNYSVLTKKQTDELKKILEGK